MYALIIPILGLLLVAMVIESTLDYSGKNIENQEMIKYQTALNNATSAYNAYIDMEHKPLDPLSWEAKLGELGYVAILPPKSTMTYNYDTTRGEYYFCIERENPDGIAYRAISKLREGYPRTFNGTNYVLSGASGYNSAYFNVNNSCGSTTDYLVEPTEVDVTPPLAATFWVGGFEQHYQLASSQVEDDFENFRSAFDSYVLANGSAPVVASIGDVFTDLRSFGKLPKKHDGFNWTYGLNGGSNYLCLSSQDTSDYTEQEREIHAETLYQLKNVYDESYFKVNGNSCISPSQSRPTDYSVAIDVYAAYWLN